MLPFGNAAPSCQPRPSLTRLHISLAYAVRRSSEQDIGDERKYDPREHCTNRAKLVEHNVLEHKVEHNGDDEDPKWVVSGKSQRAKSIAGNYSKYEIVK